MFGFRFVKTEPTQYVIRYRNGRAVTEGPGLSFFYFAPTSTLALVPTGSVNEPFMFEETTADFQDVTVQGQLTYRIAEPRRIAGLLDFTVDSFGRHLSEDPQKLSQRVLDQVRVAMRAELLARPLSEALAGGEAVVGRVALALRDQPTLTALGIEVLDLSVLAIKPTPETARALEAEAREALLGRADEALYARRRAAVEQERAIKESELETERAVQERRHRIEQEDMTGRIALEERNGELVTLATANARAEAEAKADGIGAVMKALAGAEPKVLQALASVGMEPRQLLALAFRDLADNASKIGQLNVSPDLLREIMAVRAK